MCDQLQIQVGHRFACHAPTARRLTDPDKSVAECAIRLVYDGQQRVTRDIAPAGREDGIAFKLVHLERRWMESTTREQVGGDDRSMFQVGPRPSTRYNQKYRQSTGSPSRSRSVCRRPPGEDRRLVVEGAGCAMCGKTLGYRSVRSYPLLPASLSRQPTTTNPLRAGMTPSGPRFSNGLLNAK